MCSAKLHIALHYGSADFALSTCMVYYPVMVPGNEPTQLEILLVAHPTRYPSYFATIHMHDSRKQVAAGSMLAYRHLVLAPAASNTVGCLM